MKPRLCCSKLLLLLYLLVITNVPGQLAIDPTTTTEEATTATTAQTSVATAEDTSVQTQSVQSTTNSITTVTDQESTEPVTSQPAMTTTHQAETVTDNTTTTPTTTVTGQSYTVTTPSNTVTTQNVSATDQATTTTDTQNTTTTESPVNMTTQTLEVTTPEFTIEGGNYYRTRRGLRSVPDNIPTTVVGIHLKYNKITELGNCSFCEFSSLRTLDLSYNRINIIDPNAFSGIPLLELNLESNNLTSFPAAFTNTSLLTSLVLTSNEIQEITFEDLQGLESLKSLTLWKNSLSTFPNFTQAIGDTLTSLNLEENGIKTISASSLSVFMVLTSLNLRKNGLVAFPNFTLMPAASNITILNLDSSAFGLFTSEMLEPFTRLTFLSVSSSGLTSLPSLKPIGDTLVRLEAQSNSISNLSADFFDNVTKLTDLNLAANLFTDFPDISPVRSTLKVLNIYNNHIADPPREWFKKLLIKMSALTSLYLHNNKLTGFLDIYNGIANNTIKCLTLQGNPLQCDCSMAWIKDAQAGGMVINVGNYPCVSPPKHEFRSWASLSKADLCSCPDVKTLKERQFEFEAGDVIATAEILRTTLTNTKRHCGVTCSEDWACFTFTYDRETATCIHSNKWVAGGEDGIVSGRNGSRLFSERQCWDHIPHCSTLNVSLACDQCGGQYDLLPSLDYQRPVYKLGNSSDENTRLLRFHHTMCRWVVYDGNGLFLYMSQGTTRACDPYSERLFTLGDDSVTCVG